MRNDSREEKTMADDHHERLRDRMMDCQNERPKYVKTQAVTEFANVFPLKIDAPSPDVRFFYQGAIHFKQARGTHFALQALIIPHLRKQLSFHKNAVLLNHSLVFRALKAL